MTFKVSPPLKIGGGPDPGFCVALFAFRTLAFVIDDEAILEKDGPDEDCPWKRKKETELSTQQKPEDGGRGAGEMAVDETARYTSMGS